MHSYRKWLNPFDAWGLKWGWSIRVEFCFMGMPEDFKASTRRMLEVLRGEMARLQERMDQLKDRERIVLGWIEAEEGPQRPLPNMPPMFGPVAETVISSARRSTPTLQDLFREVMQDGKARTNDE